MHLKRQTLSEIQQISVELLIYWLCLTVHLSQDAQVGVGSRQQRLLARLSALTRVVHGPPAA